MAILASAAEQEYCRTLIMSGGANNGAWEAGVIWGLANYGNESDFYYDVVSGVSTGAINAAGMAPFAPEDIKAAAQYLSDTWAQLTNDQVWQTWDKGPIKVIRNENGLLDSSPLVEYVKTELIDKFPDGFKKRAVVGSANVETGNYETFD